MLCRTIRLTQFWFTRPVNIELSNIERPLNRYRLAKRVEVESLDPLAERMIQPVFRNHHALSGISRIKTKDEYTFMQCVSVAGLLVTFSREQGFSGEELHHVTYRRNRPYCCSSESA